MSFIDDIKKDVRDYTRALPVVNSVHSTLGRMTVISPSEVMKGAKGRADKLYAANATIIQQAQGIVDKNRSVLSDAPALMSIVQRWISTARSDRVYSR